MLRLRNEGMNMKKHYTDRERLDYVKKFKQSGLMLSEFAALENIHRTTLSDWIAAYNHLQGNFIRIDHLDDTPGALINEENIRLNMLGETEISKKSNHFSRFDHSIVVIEIKKIKITTSLEQALSILEHIHDRL